MIVVAMPARQVLTNDTVIKMVKAKLDERVIVEKIRNSPGRYSLTTDSLVELSRQGWPEKVKLAMQAKQAAAPAETSTDNAPAPRRDAEMSVGRDPLDAETRGVADMFWQKILPNAATLIITPDRN